MSAGPRRHLVDIERRVTPSPATDQYGQPVEQWEVWRSIWCAVEQLSGREYWAAQQVNAEDVARFESRYIAGVATDMRIRWGASLYDIKSIEDVSALGRDMVITATLSK